MVTSDARNQQLTALMQQALGGNEQAYQAFLMQAADYIRRFLARRMPPSDVEDVLQEVLISLHKARHTYDGKRPVLPWIAAIARFRLTDYLRSHYAKAAFAHDDISDMADFLTADVTEPSSASEYVSEAVAELPERQQKILQLIHTQGYTAKEAGLQLGMKESAVKVAAHRAYKVIRARLNR